MRLPERQGVGLASSRVLDQQVTEISRRPVGGRDRQEHCVTFPIPFAAERLASAARVARRLHAFVTVKIPVGRVRRARSPVSQ